MELEKQVALTTTKLAKDPLRTEKSAAKNINPTDLAAHKKAKHQARNIDGEQDGDGAHGQPFILHGSIRSISGHQRQKAQAVNNPIHTGIKEDNQQHLSRAMDQASLELPQIPKSASIAKKQLD